MRTHEPIKIAITMLISQHYGEKVGSFFSDTYAQEIFPIFLHNSFLLLQDLVGKEKAREQLDLLLSRYNIVIPYE